MAARLMPPGDDPVRRTAGAPITVTVDGQSCVGEEGQTLAGVMLAAGRQPRSPRAGRQGGGVFCGIGVCYGCLVTVNGVADVRACQRRAADGSVVSTADEGRGNA